MAWSELSLEKNRGAHQRMSDEDLKARFVKDVGDVNKKNLSPFDFAKEAEEISRNSIKNSKGMYLRNIAWEPRLMKIPERFFGII
jgi:hypothetical protein